VGGLDPAQFALPQLVEWQSFDGRTISGFLYLPPSRYVGRRPVLIDIHGGPESQSRPEFNGRYNALLNERGVAILYPNVRGSAGYGKTFLKLDNGRLREDSVRDVSAALDWIATRADLDSGRVMILGGSYGGYMSLALSIAEAERIRCSVDVVGISNFVTFLERTESYRRDLRRVEYGDERDPELRAYLQRISPLNQAARIRKPIFIVQGQNDPRVPMSESEQMVATLKQQGTPFAYLLARDEGHGFSKKSNSDFFFCALVAFVDRHLLN
jgi:dipeptidyl aminopeptidase/acylaminoacyl peptidase